MSPHSTVVAVLPGRPGRRPREHAVTRLRDRRGEGTDRALAARAAGPAAYVPAPSPQSSDPSALRRRPGPARRPHPQHARWRRLQPTTFPYVSSSFLSFPGGAHPQHTRCSSIPRALPEVLQRGLSLYGGGGAEVEGDVVVNFVFLFAGGLPAGAAVSGFRPASGHPTLLQSKLQPSKEGCCVTFT